MATLRQYYETDFSYACRMSVKLVHAGENIDAVVLYDLAARAAFLMCYLPGPRSFDAIKGFIEAVQHGGQVLFDGRIILPSSKEQVGTKLRVVNKDDMEIEYQLLGDPTWKSTKTISTTRRLFVYSETSLSAAQIIELQTVGESVRQDVQYRGPDYGEVRTAFEHPLAFISHDSRDKDAVARPIAVNLQSMLCPVWYDEFSLKVGDHLRASIERGLRECKRCVLVLSRNFFANSGWTKREFESIFTRETLEGSQLVLPIWFGVTKQEVYDYSASLLNVVGLDWNQLGEAEICRRLYKAITN